ncbi:MAG: hypothetical protein WC961_07435 [Anaerovoracaceae bacterium]
MTNHKENAGTILRRILAFPFFAGLSLIGALSLWLRWMFNFILHGGEAIAYTDKMSRKTIKDVFERLMEEKGDV